MHWILVQRGSDMVGFLLTTASPTTAAVSDRQRVRRPERVVRVQTPSALGELRPDALGLCCITLKSGFVTTWPKIRDSWGGVVENDLGQARYLGGVPSTSEALCGVLST